MVSMRMDNGSGHMHPWKWTAHSTVRRSGIIAATCAAVVILHGTLHAQEWYVNYEKGLDAYNKQQWQAAVQSLSEAIADQSDSKANKRMPGLQFVDYFPYVYRGIAYYKLGERAKALADLETEESAKEVQDETKDTKARELLRDFLAMVRKPAAPQTDARFAEGKRLYDLKDFKKAIEVFDSVPENSPQRTQAVKYKGLAESAQRDADAAATAKERTDRISRALAAGKQYFNRKELDNAESQFKAVLDIDANHAEARRFLERIGVLRQKSVAPPVAAQKEPVREQPRIVTGPPPDTTKDVMFREAVALLSGGRIAQAKAKFLDVRRLDPAYPELGTYLKLIGDTEEKIRRGISAFFAGEYQQAIDQLRETSRAGGDNANMYAFLACSYAAKYLLSGAEDRTLRQNAVDAYGRTKQVDAGYTLNDKFISPKIIALLRGD